MTEARWGLFKAISDWCAEHRMGPDDEGDNEVKRAVDAFACAIREEAATAAVGSPAIRKQVTLAGEWAAGYEAGREDAGLAIREGTR